MNRSTRHAPAADSLTDRAVSFLPIKLTHLPITLETEFILDLLVSVYQSKMVAGTSVFATNKVIGPISV